MKFLAFIFSVYLIWLTTIPCIDVPQDNTLNKIELSGQHSEHQHQNETDHCSPFCSCNCCTTLVVFQYHVVEFSNFSFPVKQYFPVSSGFVSDPLATIWQPPKIA